MIARVAYTNVGGKEGKKATYQTSHLDCLCATRVLAPSEGQGPGPLVLHSHTLYLCLSVCLPVYLCVLSLSSVFIHAHPSASTSTSIGLGWLPPPGGRVPPGRLSRGPPSPIPCNIAGVGLPKAVVCSRNNCLFENSPDPPAPWVLPGCLLHLFPPLLFASSSRDAARSKRITGRATAAGRVHIAYPRGSSLFMVLLTTAGKGKQGKKNC